MLTRRTALSMLASAAAAALYGWPVKAEPKPGVRDVNPAEPCGCCCPPESITVTLTYGESGMHVARTFACDDDGMGEFIGAHLRQSGPDDSLVIAPA